MKVRLGDGKTKYGPGVLIELTGDEVAIAIDAYLTAHNRHVVGPRTITVNDELCEKGEIYVDPSGFVIDRGNRIDGGNFGNTMNVDMVRAVIEPKEKTTRANNPMPDEVREMLDSDSLPKASPPAPDVICDNSICHNWSHRGCTRVNGCEWI